MTANGRRRLKRFAISTAIAVAAATAAGLLLGTTAAVVASIAGFLGVAVASDDDLGTCLPLAVFFLIGLTLLIIALVATILVNT
jgi:hypothetical protein